MLVFVLLVLCLIYIFYQDLRYRAVYWWTFPLLLTLILIALFNTDGFDGWLEGTLLNLAFLALQLLVVMLYFSLKEHRLVNITQGYLGLGDVLFLFCAACYLSPLVFFAFYLVSLVFCMVVAFLLWLKSSEGVNRIPLAGLQAVFLALCLLLGRFCELPDWVNDRNLQLLFF
ncbi:hypothetical protein GS399_05365 [Pedobacter sp. HMF7647]|uniref:Prepilin type IV endopeptidase peptidase domain-containing protein n=1 Tax=Hufsiella arboris TaxID=2695275 RepID=A0A7K1Y749_9SPHI|nr:hypothetical protein [Hufsiella arboris]MXV50394.1 hypothetical protein [Hufsiella arboris]